MAHEAFLCFGPCSFLVCARTVLIFPPPSNCFPSFETVILLFPPCYRNFFLSPPPVKDVCLFLFFSRSCGCVSFSFWWVFILENPPPFFDFSVPRPVSRRFIINFPSPGGPFFAWTRIVTIYFPFISLQLEFGFAPNGYSPFFFLVTALPHAVSCFLLCWPGSRPPFPFFHSPPLPLFFLLWSPRRRVL